MSKAWCGFKAKQSHLINCSDKLSAAEYIVLDFREIFPASLPLCLVLNYEADSKSFVSV